MQADTPIYKLEAHLCLYSSHSYKLSPHYSMIIRGCPGRDHMVVGCILPTQSVSITTSVVSLNPAHARCTTLCDKVCQ